MRAARARIDRNDPPARGNARGRNRGSGADRTDTDNGASGSSLLPQVGIRSNYTLETVSRFSSWSSAVSVEEEVEGEVEEVEGEEMEGEDGVGGDLPVIGPAPAWEEETEAKEKLQQVLVRSGGGEVVRSDEEQNAHHDDHDEHNYYQVTLTLTITKKATTTTKLTN